MTLVKRRGIDAAYSRLFTFSFVISSTATMVIFPLSIQVNAMMHKVSATMCLEDLLDIPAQAPVYLIVDALDECPKTCAYL